MPVRVAGQWVFLVICCDPTYPLAANCHGCSMDCLHTFFPGVEHHSKIVPKLGKTFGVCGSQILSPDHHSGYVHIDV